MLRMIRQQFAALLRTALLSSVFVAHTAAAPTGITAGVSDAGPDATLALIVRDIEQNKLDAAMARTEALLRLYPNFRLAHLIRGDLLMARARPLSTFGDAPEAAPERLADLREEVIARLKGYRDRPAQQYVPRYLLEMPEDQKYAVVVDTQRSRLYLYRNERGRPMLAADYYISQGKAGSAKQREGDLKTPLGVYHVTSHLPRAKLTDFYGSGAFPINYPNEWDKLNGRNGHGIWLHGVPSDTYARPPKSSEGCVVLANEDLIALSGYVQVGVTPVIISDGVEWLTLDSWQAERSALNKQIESWRTDWESRDVNRYLRHYSKSFRSQGHTYDTWAQQKRQVANGKSWIKVDIAKLSMLRNPGQQELVVVTFEQDYRSSNLNNVARKRQYWVKEDGQWRIIYEGVA